MPGFGREPFGHFPFGSSNYGANTVTRVFPNSTLSKDTSGKLSNYLITIQNSQNNRKAEITDLISLVDADAIRADLLKYLGAMIAIDLDENEPIEFQRTLVRDAVQYYRIKATEKSYSIRGLISGFDVDVFRIWNFDQMYLPYIPASHRYEFPAGSGTISGIWYTDLSPDQVSGVSGSVPLNGDCTYCLTSYIKVSYTLKKVPPAPIVGNLLDRVILKIREVVPIHVRDVFVDLTIVIQTDELDAGANLLINENAEIISPYVDRYDIIAADETMTDFRIPAILNY